MTSAYAGRHTARQGDEGGVGWTLRVERVGLASDPGGGSPGVDDEMKERLAAPLSFRRSNAREGLPPLRGHWPCREYGRRAELAATARPRTSPSGQRAGAAATIGRRASPTR